MKINQSAVALEGKSSYSSYQKSEVSSILIRTDELDAAKQLQLERLKKDEDEGVNVSISKESQSLLEDLKTAKRDKAEQNKKGQSVPVQAGKAKKTTGLSYEIKDEDDAMLQTLKRILEMLRKLQKGEKSSSQLQSVTSWSQQTSKSNSSILSLEGGQLSMEAGSSSFSLTQGINMSVANVVDLRGDAAVQRGVGTAWIRHTETNQYVMEQESATFSAKGIAKTADGREIEFGIDLSMSRGFSGNLFSSKDENVILCDPLVINLESNSASVKDQKFYFDLDADGKKEQISELGNGSGFLAYDKNGDGIINDGSELFGTKSGDGFADLAGYDMDGNGWIDEGDDIFQKLKVWTKDEDGNDRLLDLKEANVGAIYLGSANTQMHLNHAYTNQTNAVIQKTGVFLHETGEVGTIQHVDLAV